MNVTHIDCRADGRPHVGTVIDGHDGELVGNELARRGGPKNNLLATPDRGGAVSSVTGM